MASYYLVQHAIWTYYSRLLVLCVSLLVAGYQGIRDGIITVDSKLLWFIISVDA